MSDDKRTFVAALSPRSKWKSKVAQMSDAQVYAIWIKEMSKLTVIKPDQDQRKDQDIPF